ncbi:Neurotransmitter-gated ion-channel ligand-binding domain [Trinorchestia longiramus]|nr:Neurotransmitter-gated ion-channel ligand-binding domain [Trinorchestia longiramus]
MKRFFLMFLWFLPLTTGQDEYWKNTQRLHEELIIKRSYSPTVCPHQSSNHTIKVYTTHAVRAIYVDELTQILTFNFWMYMHWRDQRLRWDPKDFGNIYVTEFGSREIWKPDLLVYNSAEPTNVDHYGDVPVTVYSSGVTVWYPPATIKTECPMDLTYWPFDTQTCDIYMGSWTRHGFQIDFITSNPNKTTEDHLRAMIKTSHHWTVNKLSIKKIVTRYKGLPEPYISIKTSVTVTRTSPTFAATVLIPGVAVALLTLVQFILPVDYPPRVTVGLASTFIAVLMLIDLCATLPPLGESSPLIVRYYGFSLIMSLVSVILSGGLARLSKEPPEVLSVPPPVFIKTVLTGPLASVLCLRFIADKVGRSGSAKDNEEEIIGERKSFQHEWLLVAAAVDRIAAIIYIVVFVLALFAFTSKLH